MPACSDPRITLQKFANAGMGSMNDLKAMAELWLWLDKVHLMRPPAKVTYLLMVTGS